MDGRGSGKGKGDKIYCKKDQWSNDIEQESDTFYHRKQRFKACRKGVSKLTIHGIWVN